MLLLLLLPCIARAHFAFYIYVWKGNLYIESNYTHQIKLRMENSFDIIFEFCVCVCMCECFFCPYYYFSLELRKTVYFKLPSKSAFRNVVFLHFSFQISKRKNDSLSYILREKANLQNFIYLQSNQRMETTMTAD